MSIFHDLWALFRGLMHLALPLEQANYFLHGCVMNLHWLLGEYVHNI